MRFRWCRSGLWVARGGRACLHPWRALVPFLALPPVFFLSLVLAVHRVEPTLDWLRVSRPELRAEAPRIVADGIRVALVNLLFLEEPRPSAGIPTLHLLIPDGAVDQMLRAKEVGAPSLGHDPGGDRPYFRAMFSDESGIFQRADVSLRGYGHWHHSPAKPSLRVKVKRPDVELGRRFVELQRPEDVLALGNWLPQQMGRQIGLMTSEIDPVRLFLNRKYFGLYLRNTRTGEELALRQERLPGLFLKGDAIGARGGKELWASSRNWQAYGEVSEHALSSFDEILKRIRQPGPEALSSLARFLDVEAWARFEALMIVTGSMHADFFHNHLYYQDPAVGLFEPLVWDPNAYGSNLAADAPVDQAYNPVQHLLSRDPRWVHDRNLWIARLLAGPCGEEAVRAQVDSFLERVGPSLRADANLSRLRRVLPTVVVVEPVAVTELGRYREELLRWTARRNRLLREFLQDARLSVEPHRGGSRVTVYGRIAVTAATPEGERTLYPGLAGPAAVGSEPVPMTSAPLVYGLAFPPEALRFRNAVTGAPAVPGPVPPSGGTLLSFPPDRFPPRGGTEGGVVRFPPHPEPRRVSLGPGTVVLRRDLRLGPQEHLVLAPGTRLRLAPGVGIYTRGPVTAVGRPEAPIELAGLGAEPWGCVGLTGPGTSGSRFEHLRVEGGSIGVLDGVSFSGMFNAYACPDLTLRACFFGPNRVGDDAVNLKRTHCLVEDCQWSGSRSDGLDLDACTGRISGCRFNRCGNDGLDLMGSAVAVVDCRFEGCGDKGASIGEGTSVLLDGCLVSRCSIGLEVKDGSRAAVRRTTLERCRTAYHSYRKKLYYVGEARGLLWECRIRECPQVARLEPRTRLEVVSTPLGGVPDGPGQLLKLEVPSPEWLELLKARPAGARAREGAASWSPD